jgi:hypothetical protein
MKCWDLAGLASSGLCVLHCLAMPFVVIYLPMLGLEWLAGPRAHLWMLGLGVFIGALAFVPGYRQHRRLAIPLVALCGLGAMAYAATADGSACCIAACCRQEATGSPEVDRSEVRQFLPKSSTPFGAALLLAAHVLNRRCLRSGGCGAICCAVDREDRLESTDGPTLNAANGKHADCIPTASGLQS